MPRPSSAMPDAPYATLLERDLDARAPASAAFSSTSLTTEAGRSTTLAGGNLVDELVRSNRITGMGRDCRHGPGAASPATKINECARRLVRIRPTNMKPPVIPSSRSIDPRCARETGRTVAARARRGRCWWRFGWLFRPMCGRASKCSLVLRGRPRPCRRACRSHLRPRPRAAPEASDAAVPLETGTAAGLIAGLDDGGRRRVAGFDLQSRGGARGLAFERRTAGRGRSRTGGRSRGVFCYLKFQPGNKSRRRLLQGLGKGWRAKPGSSRWRSGSMPTAGARRSATSRSAPGGPRWCEVLLAAGLPQERVRGRRGRGTSRGATTRKPDGSTGGRKSASRNWAWKTV